MFENQLNDFSILCEPSEDFLFGGISHDPASAVKAREINDYYLDSKYAEVFIHHLCLLEEVTHTREKSWLRNRTLKY